MDNQVKRTARRIAKEIARSEAKQQSWDGVERRKQARPADIPTTHESSHPVVRDRRQLPSVFANLDQEDQEDEDGM